MDFIVKLPISKTYDTILTITDTFSKASILIPCNETIDATGVAQLYANYVLPHYGLPLCIILDRDPHFTSSFFRELCRVTSAIQNLSTAYRPQTDGQSKWTNQCLEQYLRIFTIFEKTNWADCGDSLLNVVMSPVGHKEQTRDDGLDGEDQGDQGDRGPQAVLTRCRAEQC
jgi:transposase InsO family protein